MRRRILMLVCGGLEMSSVCAQVRTHARLWLAAILFGLAGTALAANFEAAVPDPPDFGMAYYPNAHFIKDHVFITYGVRQGLRTQDGEVGFVSTQRQLLIRPVRWLYEP